MIPRYPVPIWRLFLKMGGWWVIGAGGLLLFVTFLSSSSLSLAQRFEAEGRAAQATVSARYTTESRDSDGDVTTIRWLTLDYVTDARDEITISKTVGTSLYRRVAVGDTLPLLYLRSAPHTVELDPGSNRRTSRGTQIVALILGLGWLYSLWLVGGWAVGAVRARRFGARQQVKVTEIMRTTIRVNNRPRYRVVWRDQQGITGKSLLQRPERVQGVRPGDQIEIYKGLKRAWWVGDIGERPEFAEQR